MSSAFLGRPDRTLPRLLEPVLLDAVTARQSSPAQIDDHEPPLCAPLTLCFDYTRSVGPILGQFFTALRERRIVGIRGSDGRVHVPPAEYDPVTCEPLSAIVPVSTVGTVASWTRQPAAACGGRAGGSIAYRGTGARPLGRRADGRHHGHRLLRTGREGRGGT